MTTASQAFLVTSHFYYGISHSVVDFGVYCVSVALMTSITPSFKRQHVSVLWNS